MSMEKEYTGVLGKNETLRYLRRENKANKNKFIILWDIETHVTTCAKKPDKNNENAFSVISDTMSILQTNCRWKLDFQNVVQHTWSKWFIHGTKHNKDTLIHCPGCKESLKLQCYYYTHAPPKVERGYTGFTLMFVHPSVCPSVRPSVDKVSGTYLKNYSLNSFHTWPLCLWGESLDPYTFSCS